MPGDSDPVTSVRPFRALRYDTSRVDLGRVIVPPYDVISADDRTVFYDRDPHSAIRLELTQKVEDESATDYASIREYLDDWRAEGVLVRDEHPAFYGLRQRFSAPDGTTHERDGFFALLHLEDYEARIVRPHELTLAGPKADRLKVMKASQANLSVVFMLYEDRQGVLASEVESQYSTKPIGIARDDTGAVHTLTRWDDPDINQSVRNVLDTRPVVIADGHHRYETALAYRDEQRAMNPDAGPNAPFEFILAYFANLYAPGTLLLPIHRLIVDGEMPAAEVWKARLPDWEQRSVAIESPESIPQLLEEHLAPLADQHAFAADDASGELRIFCRQRETGDDLTIRVIHRDVIAGVFELDEAVVRGGAIQYPKSALRTARDLREGHGAVALYTNPLTAEEVFAVTAAGEVLPQKSTFFFPKLPTGLVFRPIEDRV
jgi:uncharacterized protein (DUF1015 family)